jgi:putative ABC transport system permease protein
LGAPAGLRESARLVLLGLLIGVPGISFAGRLLGGGLAGVSSFDPPTLAAVAARLALVAAVACYVPARRVARIEPARSLREGRAGHRLDRAGWSCA